MTLDIYSGAIDWNKIYRCFHSPIEIAARVRAQFGLSTSEILFAGFPEAAARLCDAGCDVQFVEFSDSIAKMASEQFPVLGEVRVGDILEVLERDESKDVAIVCRISAYWHTPADLERLVHSLACLPRRRVLLDFYDRDAVRPEQHVTFEAPSGRGSWKFLRFEDVSGACGIAEMEVEYAGADFDVRYIAKRAFFRRAELERFFARSLPGSSVSISEPVIDRDPSFSLIVDFEE